MDFMALVHQAQALAQSGQRRILGLVGAPGAGKSTIAERLLAALGEQAVLVPMDGFHLANVELARLGRSARKGAPDTFDVAGYVALLQRLRRQSADEIIYAPTFRREIEEPIAGAIPILARTPLVITEGNYLLLPELGWQQVRPLLDLSCYLAVPDLVRRERLCWRHQQFGRSPAEAEAWVLSTDEPNAERIAAHRHLADLELSLD